MLFYNIGLQNAFYLYILKAEKFHVFEAGEIETECGVAFCPNAIQAFKITNFSPTPSLFTPIYSKMNSNFFVGTLTQSNT